jgi:peptidoglycan/LPS O-acetylase OafA/YrhL
MIFSMTGLHSSGGTGGIPDTSSLLSRLVSRFEVGGSSARLAPMEGLRGLAVSLVFLVHYDGLFARGLVPGSNSRAISAFLGMLGNWGVELFFLLSGFLIYGYLIRKAVPAGEFLARRVQRIYPTFLLVFGAHLAVALLFTRHQHLPAGLGAVLRYVVENLLLLPGVFPIHPLVTVTWSLSYEVFFYLTIPLLIGAFRLRSRTRRWRILFFASLLAVYWGFALFGAAFHLRLSMFVAGILLYETIHGGAGELRLKAAGEYLAIAGLCAGLVIATLLHGNASPVQTLSEPYDFRKLTPTAILWVSMYLFCLYCFGRKGPSARVFAWRPLRLFGNMSYSYFLLHASVLHLLLPLWVRLAPDATLYWLFLPIAWLLTALGSAALFLMVERPLSLEIRTPREFADLLTRWVRTGCKFVCSSGATNLNVAGDALASRLDPR